MQFMVTTQPSTQAISRRIQMFYASSGPNDHDEICAKCWRWIKVSKVKKGEVIEANISGYVLKEFMQDWWRVTREGRYLLSFCKWMRNYFRNFILKIPGN